MNIKSLKTTGSGLFKLRKLLSFSLLGIFLVIILINSIVISVENKSIEPAIKDLGNRFIYSTEKINDISVQIIEQGGLTLPDNGFFSNTWLFLTTFSELFTQCYILYLWIKIFSWVCLRFVLWDDSKTTTASLISILFVYFIQALLLAKKGGSMMMPIEAIINLIKSIPYIIQPAKDIADNFVGDNFSNVTSCSLNSTNCTI